MYLSMARMELSSIFFRQWLYNHCHYIFSHSGTYKLHLQPSWRRLKQSSCLNSSITAKHFASEHHAKGNFAYNYFLSNVYVISTMNFLKEISLIVRRKKLLDWLSMWSKPLVMSLSTVEFHISTFYSCTRWVKSNWFGLLYAGKHADPVDVVIDDVSQVRNTALSK